ncbi:MAG TPA: vitamin K epoxide reductase family protein [Methylomirabilota bacterium]
MASPRSRSPGRTLPWLLAFGLLGLAGSSASAWVHYRLLQDPAYSSVCDFNATWNCQGVYESAYGAFYGIPVAVGGVLWFGLVTLLVAAAMRASRSPREPVAGFARNVPGYVFVLSVAALSVVLYLAYASFVVLQTYCVFCLITYAAVAGLFVASGAAADGAMSQLPGRALHDLRSLAASPAALGVVAIFTVAAVAFAAAFPRQVSATAAGQAAASGTAPISASQQGEFERWYASLPRVPLAVPSDGAKVLIVKFNDYLCPPCKQTYLAYKPIVDKRMRENPGQIKYVTMDYPLDPECNPGGGSHLAACEAAVAVRLARANDREDEMEEWLFANQAQLTPDMVKQGAQSVGAVQDFDARYAQTLEQVKADIRMGASLQVRGTPTFFINGVRIPIVKPEYFDAAIAYELAR